jgi:hypothetical protein
MKQPVIQGVTRLGHPKAFAFLFDTLTNPAALPRFRLSHPEAFEF